MVTRTEEMLEGWSDGDIRPMHRDMMELTLRIVVDTLFDLEFDEDIDEVAAALDTVIDHFHEQGHTLWRFMPASLPTPMRGKLAQAMEQVDGVICGLIEKRRENNVEGDDLLHHLLKAVDDEGNAMTNRQLRDEVLTMFLAGHETTALTIMYAWHFLGEHRSVEAKMREEIDRVLGDRRIEVGDMKQLPYTSAVVQETLRLYPPAWILGREAREDVELGGWMIPKGATVLLAQCLVHRDERYFDEPDEFRPERWLDGLADELPRFAYFPFGGGRRVCIGNYFAKMEAMMVIARMAQKVELRAVSSEPMKVEPSITLRPAGEVKMRVGMRSSFSHKG